jgi:hypothetical protein
MDNILNTLYLPQEPKQQDPTTHFHERCQPGLIGTDGSTSGMNTPQQEGLSRCHWGIGATRLTKFGNGTTGRWKTTHSKSFTGGHTIINRHSAFAKQEQQQLINVHGANNFPAKCH